MFTSLDDLAISAGHQVWTANIAMGVGLGIALWRSKSIPGHHLLAFVPAVAVLMLTVSDHAAYNAHAAMLWPERAVKASLAGCG